MNGLPYYPRYPRDFLDGTVGMSLELKGAYSVVLDLIYMMGDRGLMDDPQFIAGHLGCSVRKWNSIKEQLIQREKLVIENGLISNFRADKEKIIQRKFQDKQRENRSRPNKNNDLQSPRSHHTDTDTTVDTNVSTIKAKSDKNEGFDAFWSLWPHKVAKQRAVKAWQKLSIERKRDAYRAVMAGWYDDWQRRNPDANGIHPATFLNERRWEDQPANTNLKSIPGGKDNGPRSVTERLFASKRGMDSGEGGDASQPLFSTDDGGGGGGGGNGGLDQCSLRVFTGTDWSGV